MKKRILYDSEVFYTFSFGGISRYYSEIFKGFLGSEDFEFIFPIKYSDNVYLPSLKLKEQVHPIPNYFKNFLPNLQFKGKGLLFRIINSISAFPDPIMENKKLVIEELKKGAFDIFHSTYYDDYYLDYLGDKPLVITIHDMIFELYPEFFLSDPVLKRKKRIIERADHIIAVSENTKKDLIEFYNVESSKISVVYHGNSNINALVQECFIVPEIPKKFLLFVGNRERYKNFYFFVFALKRVFEKFPDVKLIVTGPPLSEEEQGFIHETGLGDFVIQKKVNDVELAYYYSKALAFIYPSLYEGFGLPILEAFGCKCPVLLSNTPCFHEIARDAALYFDPKSISDISNKIISVIQDEQIRMDLVVKGEKRLIDFTWSTTVEKTFLIYESLL
jgi:glycosyltransferase involved in cell wall biosynthesis